MKHSIKYLLFLLLAPALLNAQEIHWETDLDVAIQKATQQQKPIMLHCWFETCTPCRRLESYVFTNKAVIEAFNENVVAVKVNTETEKDVAKRFNIKSVPHDVFLTPGGYTLLSRNSPQTVNEYITVLKTARNLYRTQDAIATGGLNHKPVDQELDQFSTTEYFQEESKAPATKPVQHVNANASNIINSNPSKQATQANPHFQSNHSLHAKNANTAKSEVVHNPFVRKKPEASSQGFPKNSFTPAPAAKQSKGIANLQAAITQSATSHTSHAKEGLSAMPPATGMFQAEPSVPSVEPSTEGTEETPALDGFCPVTLKTERKWKAGSQEWGCYHRDKLFLFASEKLRDQFLATPDHYAPALAGYDPVVYEETGRLVEGTRKIGVFYPANAPIIFIFASEDSKKKFQENPAKFDRTVRLATAECDNLR